MTPFRPCASSAHPFSLDLTAPGQGALAGAFWAQDAEWPSTLPAQSKACNTFSCLHRTRAGLSRVSQPCVPFDGEKAYTTMHDVRFVLRKRMYRTELVQPGLAWIVAILCITVLALLMRST